MNRCISIIVVLILLLSVTMDVFAYDNQDVSPVNSYVNEYSLEDICEGEEETYCCDSSRIPELSIESLEQIKTVDLSRAVHMNVPTTFLDTFAAHYFLQLKNSIPDNFEGSCSYVAATMLLSFYDTYWNGNVIDNKYEEKGIVTTTLFSALSPSTKTTSDSDIISATKTKFPDNTTFTDANYYEALIDYSETDLQRKLIKIAVEEHIDGVFEYFSLFPHEVKSLLEYYLFTERGFSSSDVSVELVIPGITDIKQYAIEKVKQGIPVFVSAAESLTSAHSFIIYDYDETNDELYCHMGWGANKTHVAFSTIEYQIFEGAVSLSINTGHYHAYNYIENQGASNEKSYCSCDFSCHPEHVCMYEPYDDEQHIYSCACVNLPDNKFDHEYEYVIVSDLYHILKCDCGATSGIQEGHIYTGSGIIGYVKCIQCGFLKYVGNTIVPITKNKLPTIEAICKE